MSAGLQKDNKKNNNNKNSPSQSMSQHEKRAGVLEEICMAPSPWTNSGPGLQTSLVDDLCFLPTSRWRNTSFSSSQGRDGLLCRSSPPSVGLHWAISPVWWISCSILLSWMIWGIIQKVSYSSFPPFTAILGFCCQFLVCFLRHIRRVS